MADRQYPQNDATSPTSEYNGLRFAIEMAKAMMNTCTVVQIKSVTTSGAVAGVGRVDALPLVDLIDGVERVVQHVTVHNLSYVRLAGGSKAVIMDPVVGDIGVAVIADRDISVVKASGSQSPPGSRRRYNLADGIYVSTILGSTPSSYLQFESDGSITASPDGGQTYVNLKNGGPVTIGAPGSYVVVDCPDIRLGGADASIPVAGEGTGTSDGATLVNNFLTTVKGK